MCSGLLRSWFIALFLSCLVPTGALAQVPDWPITGPAFAASPADIQAAAAKIPAEPLTEATIFFERDSNTFDAAGRLIYRAGGPVIGYPTAAECPIHPQFHRG